MSAEETPNNDSIRAEPPPPPSAPISPSAGELTQDDKMWAMLAHLSALLAVWLGFGFIGPLIIWIIKKDQSKFVDVHGKESLNFQLNIFIYILICVAIGSVTCGFGFFVTGPLAVAVAIYGLVMPIIAGVKANSGEYYEYPATFRMIK
jgi:uncharacterized Tic20 family protein